MDPSAALATIRRLLVRVQEHQDLEVNEFAEAVRGLDEWLTNGGSLPGLWAKGRMDEVKHLQKQVEEVDRIAARQERELEGEKRWAKMLGERLAKHEGWSK